jgi:DNA-binding winged helix-turn-helix (wHTH) protein
MKQFESFGLDTANRCLVQNGVPIELAPKPFAVLRYLVENPGRLITHDELLDALWPETYVQPQVLRTYMLELRKVLGDDAGQPRFIQTLPKRGYRFVAQVREKAAVASHDLAKPEPDGRAAPAIVGRDSELAMLHAELKHLAQDERRVVFVAGSRASEKRPLLMLFASKSAAPPPLG